MVVSPEQAFKSATEPELVHINYWGDETPMRALTKGELVKVEDIEASAYGTFETTETAKPKRGMRQKKKPNKKQAIDSELQTKGKIDLAKQNKASYEGQVYAIKLSLTNEHPDALNPAEKQIKAWASDLHDELFENVQRLSGIDIEDEDEEDEDGDFQD